MKKKQKPRRTFSNKNTLSASASAKTDHGGMGGKNGAKTLIATPLFSPKSTAGQLTRRDFLGSRLRPLANGMRVLWCGSSICRYVWFQVLAKPACKAFSRFLEALKKPGCGICDSGGWQRITPVIDDLI